ncbi:2-amino-3-ketobutyrate coenzyme A ligase [Listeria grandensis FSL F6-0971]|uniref:2-amino-3-ketobutyrate coenzyme A ligase n=1 Tax=Listeria grandensis FSL F6-0971 TaxID=1265819 RepID=W7BDB1_9LIST|nr:2-amino-3-ketobutyrate coenzyme A ligase [Listeria grandensis FSL F6-0971]
MTNNVLNDFLEPQLQALREQGLYNTIDTVEGPNGAKIKVNGAELINLSSNNYLGFSNDDRLKKKCIEATEQYGVGAGAVRTINGTMTIHNELEERLAEFKHTEAAIAFQSGFNCNMGQFPLS